MVRAPGALVMLRPAAAALALALAGCSRGVPPPAAPLTAPTAMCTGEPPTRPCREPLEIEAMLARAPLEVLASADPPAGKQDAHVLTLVASTPKGRVVFRAKWRAAESAHQLNSPRKEVCAHAVQKLVFEPHDWVVPPAASRCLPVAQVRAHIDPAAAPSFQGGACALGFLSYWFEDARDLDAAEADGLIGDDTPLDPASRSERPSFRRSIADANLLAYLISHGDSHKDQFVVTGTAAAPALRLVDNTIAFTPYRNPSLGEAWRWSRLQVPALRADAIARLRTLRPADLDRLLVVEQHALRDGMLVAEPPGAAPPESPGGVRWVGDHLQIGMTRAELRLLRGRLRSLLRRVEIGAIATF
jgi:hypothetical protein